MYIKLKKVLILLQRDFFVIEDSQLSDYADESLIHHAGDSA